MIKFDLILCFNYLVTDKKFVKKGDFMKELDDYVINYETLVIMPYGDKKSKVYEFDEIFIVNKDVLSIINDSCLYFGSSLSGRREGTMSLMNCEIIIVRTLHIFSFIEFIIIS